MNSFYNILKIARDPNSNDSVAIGLIAYSSNRYFFQFSVKKMKIAKSLLDDNSDFVDFFENQIVSKFSSLNKSIESAESTLFVSDKLLTADYFNYMNRYSNNLVQFSKPFYLNKDIDINDFKKLFALLIGDDFQYSLKDITNQQEFETRIKEKLIDTVKEKVHVYAKLTEKVVPSLYFPFELDCIGMNGVITAAKSIDFNRNEVTIDRNLSHYFQISTLLAKIFNKDKRDNNFYLIADEPEKVNSKEHHIWVQLKKQKQFEIIHSEEAHIIANKIDETNSHKFLDIE
jgi:hypothetical protein